MSAQLTTARKRALVILRRAAEEERSVRISNQTTDATVYWQSADWLVKNGLAEVVGFDRLLLTAAGRDIARAVGS